MDPELKVILGCHLLIYHCTRPKVDHTALNGAEVSTSYKEAESMSALGLYKPVNNTCKHGPRSNPKARQVGNGLTRDDMRAGTSDDVSGCVRYHYMST